MKNKYTVDYFIEKFKAIPRNKWMTGDYEANGKRCALGHCGYMNSLSFKLEAGALIDLFTVAINITEINDGYISKYAQRTPKGRILAALRNIKKNGKI